LRCYVCQQGGNILRFSERWTVRYNRADFLNSE